MISFFHQFLFILGIIGLPEQGTLSNQNAKPAAVPDSRQEQELSRAESNLQAELLDSTLAQTGRLLNTLKARQQINTPFGIRVRLIRAIALERNAREANALSVLLQLEKLSRQQQCWDLHAQVHLELALIYEKNQFAERSRQHLFLAKTDIDRYGLKTVYPRYAVRMSSWHRWFKDKDSSLFYAREAQRTAFIYGLPEEEADGHLMESIVLPKSDFIHRIEHAKKEIDLLRRLKDQQSLGTRFINIAKMYISAHKLPQAMAYCDSALAHKLPLTDNNTNNRNRLHNEALLYQTRGEIYRQLGRPDSALTNIIRGNQFALAAKDEEIRDKIREIDSRDQIKRKEEQLDEQQLIIQLKNNQLRYTFIFICLVIASAIGLYLAYTKQRAIKQQLQQQNTLILQQATQLRQLDAAKSRFFANVSHELRTPLTLLLGPIGSLLTKNKLSPEQKSLLTLAVRNGRQLEQLVTDILDLGKLELGKMELQELPTALTFFFQRHIVQFESLAVSRQLTLSFSSDVVNEPVVLLDQSKCRQILNNLLANAFKFTPPGGQITTSLSVNNGRLILRIADTGHGISADDLPYVFDRYFQTSQPDNPARGGTGIGLALSQEYARLMGGLITVESKLGIGTEFRLSLPVTGCSADEAAPATIPAPVSEESILPVAPANPEHPPAGSPSPDRPTILIAEDNPDLQTYLRLLLSDRYNLVMAANGQQALEQLQKREQWPVSLILSDIMMPVMDGHQLLEALKANDALRHIPVVMLTARADMQHKLRALRIGVDDYLLKPFDEQELLARIANLLANQSVRNQAIIHEQPDTDRPTMSQADQEWLKTFEAYVQHQLADPTLTIPALADHFAMSESTLLRQLKRLTGLSPLQYVQAVRLETARQLLENRSVVSITQLAARVGFSDVRSFSRNFRTRFGKRPSELLDN